MTENDEFVMVIHPQNEVNANEEHLLEKSNYNKEEMVVETANNLSESLVIGKDITDDRRAQHDLDLMVMKNIENN